MEDDSHGVTGESLLLGIETYLLDCFRRSSPPRVEELAASIGLHPVVLRRRVKGLLGTTICHYLKIAQLRFACHLLGERCLLLDDVAVQAAFGSRRAFLRTFQRELHQTPTDYRRSPKVSLDAGEAAT
jgi:AraC-like DNA-binding protein